MKQISCLINTLNADTYLEEVILSIPFVNDLVIVDMGSTDRTLEIASKYKARVFSFPPVGYVEPARAFGVEKCLNEWVLILDADEIVPPKLQNFITTFVTSDQYDVYTLCFRNFLFGVELKGSSWSYRDFRKPFLFRKGFVEFGDVIHKAFKVKENSRWYEKPDYELAALHFNYDSVFQFIEKLNRYTTHEKPRWNSKFKVFEMIYGMAREFFGRFVYKKGFRDGWIGFYLACAMAFYRATVVAKANTESGVKNQEDYKKLARQLIKNG